MFKKHFVKEINAVKKMYSLDNFTSTLYSLDSMRSEKLVHQLVKPPARFEFEQTGRLVYFISNRCNLNCIYCNGLPQEIVPPRISVFENILRRYVKLNLKYLHLTGLEPTLEKNILAFVATANIYGLEISMSTNGCQPFEVYKRLSKNGLKYIFISLDAHNESTTRIMGGSDLIYEKVSENIIKLSDLKAEEDIRVIVCLVVTKYNIWHLPEIIYDFIHRFKPDDIRLIPSTNDVFSDDDKFTFKQRIIPQLADIVNNKYPFLKYRIQNYFSVRGLENFSVSKCYLVLDEKTIGGGNIYPCNIYVRERGKPIASLEDENINEKIWQWFSRHNVSSDSICRNYCCDVTREYNMMTDNIYNLVVSGYYFNVHRILETILSEETISELFILLRLNGLSEIEMHSKYTALYAGKLGMELGWHYVTVYYLIRSALMHDIGKAHYSIAEISSRGGLNSPKKKLMKEHICFGRDMLHHAGYRVEGDIAFLHHERIDGEGYIGKKLNWPMAEIVGLADAYSALTEERYGRKAFSPEVAISMISKGKCGIFREEYLELLNNLYREGKLLVNQGKSRHEEN